jgi:SpoVK/Ycf46/Vps4 family AAA+-type ATPase
MDDPIIASLRKAIEAAPDDIPLRLHLGRMLLTDGKTDEAIALAGAVLGLDPGNQDARVLMADAMALPAGPATPSEAVSIDAVPIDAVPIEATADSKSGFDWSAAEKEVDGVAQPMFVDGVEPDTSAFDVERSSITLADVGGMKTVKERLTAAFLAPLRNPELRALYGKSLRGGLLMYGPPGCGKTFIARALAGELGAKFISVGISDILNMYIGESERNLHELFALARREAPVVLFFDEIDALGQRRSMSRSSGTRNTVNQLLNELDGVDGSNEGVFVLAATNQPWDVDPALRRPGRFDRTVLVLPPDLAAREAIFRYHLASRPVEGIDLAALAKASDGLSGADIAYVCEVAAERALTDSALSGVTRLITMQDVTGALREATPSIGSWLDSAKNVVLFGDGDGTYAELKDYLKKAKRL